MGSLENTHQLGPYKVGPYQLYPFKRGEITPGKPMWFSVIDRGYPCHFPEGWRVNDLNPKELKPFASGAFRHDLRQKNCRFGEGNPLEFLQTKCDWWIDWMISSWYWRVWEKHDITENFTYGGDQLGTRRWSAASPRDWLCEKNGTVLFLEGGWFGGFDWREGLEISVCVFFLVWCCYVMLCYVMCFLIIFAPFGEVHYYYDDHYTYTSPSWKFGLGPCLVISLVFFGCFRPKTAKFTCDVGLDI